MFWAEIRKISEFLSENFYFFGGKIFNIFEKACFRNDSLSMVQECIYWTALILAAVKDIKQWNITYNMRRLVWSFAVRICADGLFSYAGWFEIVYSKHWSAGAYVNQHIYSDILSFHFIKYSDSDRQLPAVTETELIKSTRKQNFEENISW